MAAAELKSQPQPIASVQQWPWEGVDPSTGSNQEPVLHPTGLELKAGWRRDVLESSRLRAAYGRLARAARGCIAASCLYRCLQAKTLWEGLRYSASSCSRTHACLWAQLVVLSSAWVDSCMMANQKW